MNHRRSPRLWQTVQVAEIRPRLKCNVPLYVPPHFESEDVELAKELISSYPFATLISYDSDEPWITHLPLFWDPDRQVLLGHMARANPHSLLIESASPTLAIFAGPHAYISPKWYETPGQVPTWNYAVAHMHGVPTALNEGETVHAVLALARRYEPEFTMDRDRLAKQALGVVGFSLQVERVDLKLKMSQNKTEADRLNVVEALLKRDGPDDDQVASWIGLASER